MPTSQSAILSLPDPWAENSPIRLLFVIAALQLAVGIASTIYGWPVAAAPILVVLLSIAFALPRIGLLFLMLSMFSKQGLFGTTGIYASDVVCIGVLAGILIRKLAEPSAISIRNPLRGPLLAIAVYFGLTILWAFHPMPALVNWLRHVQLICLGLLIADAIEINDIPRILGVMVAATVVISLFTFAEFSANGGRERIFGPTGWFFTTFLAMTMIHSSVGAVLAERRITRSWWMVCGGICFLGLIATQTRSAMLQAMLGIIVAVGASWIWSGRNHKPFVRRRIAFMIAITTVMILVFMFGQIAVFQAASSRVEQAIEGRSNTIFIRLLLWKMGWTVFTQHPVFGAGLGQASQWSEQFNFFHLDPASPRAAGLGVHNDAITYLAETGAVGTILIFWLFWVVCKMGWRLLTTLKEQRQAQLLLFVLAPAGAIIAHYFYSAYLFYSIGGMVVAFYFGMLAKLHSQWYVDHASGRASLA